MQILSQQVWELTCRLRRCSTSCLGRADCDTARFTVLKINAIRREAGSWSGVFGKLLTQTHTLQNFFFYFFFFLNIWDILRSSSAVMLNVQVVFGKISETLLKGAMCCVFKHQYVTVKLIVTLLCNYYKQMRQWCR